MRMGKVFCDSTDCMHIDDCESGNGVEDLRKERESMDNSNLTRTNSNLTESWRKHEN